MVPRDRQSESWRALGWAHVDTGVPEVAAARLEDREPGEPPRCSWPRSQEMGQPAGPAWGRGGLEGGGAGLGPFPVITGMHGPHPSMVGVKFTGRGSLRALLPLACQGFQMSPGQSSGTWAPRLPLLCLEERTPWPRPPVLPSPLGGAGTRVCSLGLGVLLLMRGPARMKPPFPAWLQDEPALNPSGVSPL